MTLLHHSPGVGATRVLLAGVGKPEKFAPAELRSVSGSGPLPQGQIVKSVLSTWTPSARRIASAAVEGAILGDFEPDRYKTGDDKKSLDTFAVARAGPRSAV